MTPGESTVWGGLLTIMSDINGTARSENGESTWITKTSSVRGVVGDLYLQTKGINT